MANILIADSDPAVRQLIATTLRDSGHTLFQAEDGNKTIEVVRSSPIHAVLADRALPGPEAADLIVQIRKLRPQAPVILFADSAEEDPDQLLDAGAFSVVSKPFEVSEIRRAVDEALPAPIRAILEAPVRTEAPSKEKPAASPRFPWAAVAATILTLALAGAGGVWYWKKTHRPPPPPPPPEPVGIYSVPGDHLSGVAPAGPVLWTCDWFGQALRRHHLDAVLSPEKTVLLSGEHPSALAWDGRRLWSASAWERKLVRHSSGERLSPEEEIPIPWPEISGLSADNGTFWACDGREGKIVHFRVEKGKIIVLAAGASPGQKPVGVAVAGGWLWSADGRTGLIYKHRTDPGFPVVEVSRPPDELKGEKITCFAFDGKVFWIGTASQKLFRVLPIHLKPVAAPR